MKRTNAAGQQIAVPIVHLNGTAGEDLSRQLAVAMDGLAQALRAMYEAAPNARDYYPQGYGDYTVAMRQFEDRLVRVQAVKDELEVIWNAVQDQMEARASRG